MFKFTLIERTDQKYTVQQAIDQAFSVVKLKYPKVHLDLTATQGSKLLYDRLYQRKITMEEFDTIVVKTSENLIYIAKDDFSKWFYASDYQLPRY